MYEYQAPYGTGDTFFQYVFDAQTARLVDGVDYSQRGVQVNDGQFLLRYWTGVQSIAERFNIYDWMSRRFWQNPVAYGVGSGQPCGQGVLLPEVVYPDGGNIRFDLIGTQQTAVDTGVLASQLVFSGARRRKGVIGDPQPSDYKYYEKEFSYPFEFTVPANATLDTLNNFTQYKIPIADFDFELRRVEMEVQGDGAEEGSGLFKILMYDTNWVQMSNLPVLSHFFFHLNPDFWPELNYWPCPPVMYRLNSVMRFNIYSLITAGSGIGAQTYNILFKGVRRIPCG